MRVHSIVRIRLGPECKVLVCPALPLMLLPPSLPIVSRRKLSSTTHAVSCSQDPGVLVDAYRRLADQVHHLHHTTTQQENVHKMEKRVLKKSTVTIVKGDECLKVLSTSWHLAVEDLVLSAVAGMPATFATPLPTDQFNVKNLGLFTKLFQCVVVGDANDYMQPLKYKGATRKPVTLLQRNLKFDESDLEWIVSKAAVHDSSNYCMWYLTCPFPQILLRKEDCSVCVKEKCSRPIKLWKPSFNVPPNKVTTSTLGAVANTALVKVFNFILRLQSKLPEMHYVTVFPIFPTDVVSYDSIETSVHEQMHELHRDYPKVFFSPQPITQVLSPIIERFNAGWFDIFCKLRYGHSIKFDASKFSQIRVLSICDAQEVMSSTVPDITYAFLGTVNSVLENHAIHISGKFSVTFHYYLR